MTDINWLLSPKGSITRRLGLLVIFEVCDLNSIFKKCYEFFTFYRETDRSFYILRFGFRFFFNIYSRVTIKFSKESVSRVIKFSSTYN